jgi:mono/diheme cytochrome c family protein
MRVWRRKGAVGVFLLPSTVLGLQISSVAMFAGRGRERMITIRNRILLLAVVAAVTAFSGFSHDARAQIDCPVSEHAFERTGAWDESYSKGHDLFAENCAACHGDSGRGVIGLPLNLQSFLVIADTGYLVRSMKYGRPLRGMPPFDEMLTPEEMKLIAVYIKGWQYEPSLVLPVVHDRGNASDGGKLFKGICVGCHGLRGEGGPNVGGGHVIGAVSGFGAPALSDPGFLKSASDGYIKATLMYGRVGTPMGAYLKGLQGFVELREEEIDNIVAYIRSLEPRE